MEKLEKLNRVDFKKYIYEQALERDIRYKFLDVVFSLFSFIMMLVAYFLGFVILFQSFVHIIPLFSSDQKVLMCICAISPIIIYILLVVFFVSPLLKNKDWVKIISKKYKVDKKYVNTEIDTLLNQYDLQLQKLEKGWKCSCPNCAETHMETEQIVKIENHKSSLRLLRED